MNSYTFEQRDFTKLNEQIEKFNKIPRGDGIDNFNRLIDIDYISNSDEIEGENTNRDLLNILDNPNFKVLRSYPNLVVDRGDIKKGNISDRIYNISGMSEDEQFDKFKDFLKDGELVVYDTVTGEEFHVKTTGHMVAVSDVLARARQVKQLKKTTGEDTDLTAEFIADHVNCHVLGERFGRYRSPWYYPIVGLQGVDWVVPGGHRVDDEMNALLDWYNNDSKDLHPIERAAIFHIEFIRIHPFADGNGRTARLLTNYELVKNGYPTITIKASQRGEYLAAINKAILTGDATDMVDLMTSRVESRMRQYDKLLVEKEQCDD